MAKMKIEVLAAANKRRGLSLRDRLMAYLPRYAPYAAKLAPLMNARDAIPGVAALTQRMTGLSAQRRLPRWRRDVFDVSSPPPSWGNHDGSGIAGETTAREVALFADTFNTAFEPENLHAAVAVLTHLGYRVSILQTEAPNGTVGPARPLCCGRTFLSAGLVEEARSEARRVLEAALPFVARGVPVVGLEPSCLLTLRDEFLSMLPGEETERLSRHALLFEEFLTQELEAGRIESSIARHEGRVLLHGHCHQKAFAVMPAIQKTLGLVDGLKVETIESSCCGMAGAFGYGADTHAVSMAMAELSLLPAVRSAPADAVIAADGFSCRHQIADGAGRKAEHVAQILWRCLAG
jgi:Fe-S oxidoreductase